MENKKIPFSCPWDYDPSNLAMMTTTNYFAIENDELIINLGSSYGNVWIIFEKSKDDIELAKKARDMFTEWVDEAEGA